MAHKLVPEDLVYTYHLPDKAISTSNIYPVLGQRAARLFALWQSPNPVDKSFFSALSKKPQPSRVQRALQFKTFTGFHPREVRKAIKKASK